MKALITTDGSPLSVTVLETARQVMALVPDAELHLVKVLDAKQVHDVLDRSADPDGKSYTVSPSLTVESPHPRVVESHGEALERIRHDEVEALESLSKSKLGDTPVRCHVRWSDEPARAITDLANELDADVILMATHGRSGISHLLAGSVTESVIRSSGRPVLVNCPVSQWMSRNDTGAGESEALPG